MPSCYPRLVHHPILRRGTIGAVGTMVPICVGGRENRGPGDHVRTIFYMSRATPEKRKEWPARHGSRPARPRPHSSLAHQDHGPGGPNGPDGCLEFGKSGLRFAQAPTGPSRLDGPDTARGASNLRRTPSRRVVPKCWSGRPPALSAWDRERHRFNRLWPSRFAITAGRMSRPVAGAVVRSGYPRGSRRAARTPLDAHLGQVERPRRSHGGNNCWRSSPVFSFCF